MSPSESDLDKPESLGAASDAGYPVGPVIYAGTTSPEVAEIMRAFRRLDEPSVRVQIHRLRDVQGTGGLLREHAENHLFELAAWLDDIVADPEVYIAGALQDLPVIVRLDNRFHQIMNITIRAEVVNSTIPQIVVTGTDVKSGQGLANLVFQRDQADVWSLSPESVAALNTTSTPGENVNHVSANFNDAQCLLAGVINLLISDM